MDLRRLAADLRDGGTGAAAIAQQGEAERLHEAGVLTTTFQKAEALLDQVVQDQSESAEKRVAMADIRGRFGYMKRVLSRAPSTELGNLATNAAMPIGLRPSAKGPDAHPVSIQGTGQVWVNVQKMTRRKSGNSAFGAGLLPKRTHRAAR